jgi:peptidyl-dipeptidase Dcp
LNNGLAVHDREIKVITDNKAKATFQNTVLALETSGVDFNQS